MRRSLLVLIIGVLLTSCASEPFYPEYEGYKEYTLVTKDVVLKYDVDKSFSINSVTTEDANLVLGTTSHGGSAEEYLSMLYLVCSLFNETYSYSFDGRDTLELGYNCNDGFIGINTDPLTTYKWPLSLYINQEKQTEKIK